MPLKLGYEGKGEMHFLQCLLTSISNLLTASTWQCTLDTTARGLRVLLLLFFLGDVMIVVKLSPFPRSNQTFACRFPIYGSCYGDGYWSAEILLGMIPRALNEIRFIPFQA